MGLPFFLCFLLRSDHERHNVNNMKERLFRNASANIHYLGRNLRTGGLPGLACGSNLVEGRKQEEDGSSQVAQAA